MTSFAFKHKGQHWKAKNITNEEPYNIFQHQKWKIGLPYVLMHPTKTTRRFLQPKVNDSLFDSNANSIRKFRIWDWSNSTNNTYSMNLKVFSHLLYLSCFTVSLAVVASVMVSCRISSRSSSVIVDDRIMFRSSSWSVINQFKVVAIHFIQCYNFINVHFRVDDFNDV